MMPPYSVRTRPPFFSPEMKVGWILALMFHIFAFCLFSIAILKNTPIASPFVIVESINEESISLSESQESESKLTALLKNPPLIPFRDSQLFFDESPNLPIVVLYEPPLFENQPPSKNRAVSHQFFGTKNIHFTSPEGKSLTSKHPFTALLDIRLSGKEKKIIWFEWIAKTEDDSLNKEIETYVRNLRVASDVANEFIVRGSLEFFSHD